jgi:serine/threonine-protein kinase
MQGVLVPGSTFGAYVVGAPIGEGGMARIYRAEHVGLRRQVALKVLINGFAKDPEGRERFVREARIAAAIKHPNVVNIFDVGVHEGIPFLVMELLEGTDLEALLESKGALDENTIVDIMVPIVAGLTAVHDAGIVHRDLKPGNIFLARGRYDEFEPKLLDFGISKATGSEHLKLTTNGLLIGTPFYMSAEGLRGEEMTPLSDQYSLGVMTYECATGKAPFAASTLPELVQAISNGEFTPPNEANPVVSKRLARIIQRAMSLDPEQRFKDLREMGRELLLLAGQRTRITWGLSFGDLPNQEARQQGSLMPVGGSVAPKASLSYRGKVAAWTLAALVPLLLFAAWSQSQEGVEPSGQAATDSSMSPTLKAHAAVPQLAAPAVPTPVATVEKSTAPAVEVLPLPRPAENRGVHRAQPSRPSAPAAPTQNSNVQDAAPDWALPGTPTAQAKPAAGVRARPPAGANGAPIFD